MTDELLAADPEAIAAMDRRLVPRMSDGSLARVKIWSIDGVVLYSDEHRLIGRNFASDLDLDELRPGGPAVSSISDLTEGENLFESEHKGLVEVYSLLPSEAGPDVIYELYLPLVLVERERNELVAQMAPAGMLALGTLALSQLPLAVGLARKVSRIRHSRTRLLAQTVKAVELERRRLAQDLHDDVIQDLSGVAVALESVGRDGGRQDGTVDRAAEILRRDVRRLRDIVANLFPTNAYEGGLDAAIRDLTAGLGSQGVAVSLDLDPDHGLDLVTAGLIHRVAREAVVNVAKHSHATTLHVLLSITPDAVHLEVTDDGRGPDPVPSHRVAGHVGLDIVRETIEEAGGSVVLEAGSPLGTTVRAYLPR